MTSERYTFLPRLRESASEDLDSIGFLLVASGFVCYVSYDAVLMAAPIAVYLFAFFEAGGWYINEYRPQRIERAVEHTPTSEDLSVSSLLDDMRDSSDAGSGLGFIILSFGIFFASGPFAADALAGNLSIAARIAAEVETFFIASAAVGTLLGGVELVMRGVDS